MKSSKLEINFARNVTTIGILERNVQLQRPHHPWRQLPEGHYLGYKHAVMMAVETDFSMIKSVLKILLSSTNVPVHTQRWHADSVGTHNIMAMLLSSKENNANHMHIS